MSTDAGWYPDPHDPSKARYWDGANWTDQTQELRAEPPAPEFAEEPAAAETPPAAEPSEPPPEEPPPPAEPPDLPPPPPPSPPGAPPGESDAGGWWRRPWAWGSALAVIAAAVVAVVLLTQGGTSSAEVILEPTAAEGSNPFTESVATERVDVDSGGVKHVTGKDTAVESVSGETPELYGGTGEEAVCDPKQLVSFLEDNPDKAGAFAGALGIKPGKIGDYVAGLTPVVLREDTRVTNHGFENGEANPFQAVLQAGTAVMVDDRGVPRVRCACGNPLSEPAAVSSAPEFSGEQWESFDEDRLVAVSPSGQPIDSLELVDVNTGEVYEQTIGGEADCSIEVGDVSKETLAIDVSSSGVDCSEAKRIFEGYYFDQSIPHEGSGGAATVDDWFCISYSAGDEARGERKQTTCTRGEEEIHTLHTSRSGGSNGCGPGLVPFEGACVDESTLPGSGSTSSAGTLPSGATEACGSGIYVGPNTSCPFARNVADTYRSSGGKRRIDVYSPTTGRSYRMTCTPDTPHVCTGGRDASVYFR